MSNLVINVESERVEVTFSNPVHNPRWVLVCPALPRSNVEASNEKPVEDEEEEEEESKDFNMFD